MVVVGAARPDQELWREATAFAPVLIEFSAHGAESTPRVLAETGVDLCIIDAALSDTSKMPVIEAARAKRPVPLVFFVRAEGHLAPGRC
jgi:hypothetical protein